MTKTLLFLTPRYPWPLIGGDRIKSYFLLRHLASKYRVILVTFSHGKSAPAEYIDAMQSLGIELHIVRLNPLLAAVGCLRTFWTRQPIEISFYNRPAFAHAVREVLATNTIDIGVAFFMRTAEYIRTCADMRKILIAEDSRIEYQTRSMNASKHWLQRLVRWWEIRKLRNYEPGVIHDFDAVTYVSHEDVAAMESILPSTKYAIVTNGVDVERFSFQPNQYQRSGILFIGKLDVHANELMVDTIVEQVMPLVHASLPEVTVTIVGEPRPSKHLKNDKRITFTGRVPDGVPYLHQAAVFLHPHAGGSGIQNKLLEAMAAGCAVVTTRTGLQGIEAEHGKHCLVFATIAEASAYVVRLLNDPDERASLASNARTLIEQTHSWQLVDAQMDAVIEDVTALQKAAPTMVAHHASMQNAPQKRGALFLDRDGIINERIVDGYVRTPSEFLLLPDILPLIAFARERGMPVVVITNQQGVGKGLMTDADLSAVHDRMNEMVSEHSGQHFDGIYVCTSLASANDPRRKPNPGMILEAIQDHNIDPEQSWFIGDSLSDAEAGKRAGVRTMLVGPFPPHTADVVVEDLHLALEKLLAQ